MLGGVGLARLGLDWVGEGCCWVGVGLGRFGLDWVVGVGVERSFGSSDERVLV